LTGPKFEQRNRFTVNHKMQKVMIISGEK